MGKLSDALPVGVACASACTRNNILFIVFRFRFDRVRRLIGRLRKLRKIGNFAMIYDIAIVGAGPAGLSAALYAARFCRSTIVLHNGDARASRIPKTNNAPGFDDGVAGPHLIERMTRHAERYGAQFVTANVGRVGRTPTGFEIVSDEGANWSARALILATGLHLKRDLFSLPGINAALAEAEKADLVVYSLITLAILPEAARTRLLALNARVAFDSNYRPRLWPDATTAATVRDAAIARASIGLPTLEDEIQMSGETTADAVGLNWQSRGCIETVVKMGVMGCRLPVGDIIAPTKRLSPIDTSGAGDAFNAGYLHARMFGATPTEAAKEGNYLAGQVLNHPGAIPLFSV